METVEKNEQTREAAHVEKKNKGKRRRKVIRRIILLVLLLAVLAAAAYLGYLRLRQQYTVTYQEYNTTIGTISNSLSFSGTLQAVNNTIYTASSSGTVRNVYVSKDQDVKAGDALLRLSNGQTVEAEFDGRINQLPVTAGDKVSTGDTLIQVVDFDHMQVSVRVDEYDISDVHAGDECRVTTTATENTFSSSIHEINYVSSSTGSVAYYTATAYVDVTEGVYPGMQVTVTVPQEEASNVVILREDALSFDMTNQAFVYTRNANGDMETTYVKTGVSNGNYVEIKEGLKSGDSVYVEVETTASSMTSLLASLFGGQQFTGGQGGMRNMNPGNYNFNNYNGGGNQQNNYPGGFGGGRQ